MALDVGGGTLRMLLGDIPLGRKDLCNAYFAGVAYPESPGPEAFEATHDLMLGTGLATVVPALDAACCLLGVGHCISVANDIDEPVASYLVLPSRSASSFAWSSPTSNSFAPLSPLLVSTASSLACKVATSRQDELRPSLDSLNSDISAAST